MTTGLMNQTLNVKFHLMLLLKSLILDPNLSAAQISFYFASNISRLSGIFTPATRATIITQLSNSQKLDVGGDISCFDSSALFLIHLYIRIFDIRTAFN